MRAAWRKIREHVGWPRVAAVLWWRSRGNPRDLVEERFVFGRDPQQYVLAIRPAAASATKPLIAFVHGGSWAHFSPATFHAVGRWFARQGYATALLGYRLVPGAVFPAQWEDVCDGLAATLARPWFSEACDGSVLTIGQSSGGQLAALLALDEQSRAERGLGGLRIAGLVCVSGTVDFALMGGDKNAVLRAYMGGGNNWETADPAHFAHATHVPIFCLHGSRDPLVPVEAAASFVLRANGAEGDHASLLADPRGHHGSMTHVLLGRSPLSAALLEWMEGLPAV